MNQMGETFELPLDVKTIGSSILSEQGITELKQIKIFSNYLELDCNRQLEYFNKWKAVSTGTHSEKTIFIMNLAREVCP